jgi:DNA polymerase-1
LDNRYIAFDYEATGIKLNAKGHKIICMSIATDKNAATAFPMFYGEIFQDLLKKILTDFWVKKAIANAKYEFLATKCILDYEVQGIYRDTMLNAHVLDNREEVTGLKFQTYVKYGTSGYNSTVEPYMESDEDFGNNSFNKLDILFKRDPVSVLTYCGMDSMFTFRLGEDQADELLKNNLYNGANLLLEGTLALADVENNGIRVDTNYYRNQDLIQDRKIRRISKKIQDSSEVKEWNKIKRTEFNPDSPTQLNNLFYGILKYEPTKLTNKGAPSVDKEVLFDLNTEFANLILEYRKLSGLKEKINGILIETVDGILRCHFNLNLVRSQRSSSSNVNWQNFPKRDKESFKLARSGIIPRKGHQLGEVDYSGIEVRGAAMVTKDPSLIKYITDPSSDMHRDTSMDIFLLEQNQVTKKIRYLAKNAFVFASFYGSYFKQTAPDLYKRAMIENLDDGTSLIKHLKKHGINTYEKFENHIQKVEDKFWNERFKVYNEWKNKTWEEYQNKGYVESLSGFRFIGLMKRNEVLNYPIQSISFHILLWSLIQINTISKREKWDSHIIGQIHDSIVTDLNPSELNHVISTIKKVMCEDVKKHFTWINVPLKAEIEIAGVDGSWYDMKEYKEDEIDD